MSSIVELWKNNKEYFSDKSIQQILNFTSVGKLADGNATSNELRDFFNLIPTDQLSEYAKECLAESFTDSGFVLQDIINEIGIRLGFTVTPGLYRGKKDKNGYDGIWTSQSNYKTIIEVKTTDAYRINLDTISDYREKLIEGKEMSKGNSSILIVVGRQDTGDLEAQIRGSRHAWDIRLISVERLIQLLNLKEKLNDAGTVQLINDVIKPFEYTRIDKLIDLIFITSADIEFNKEDFENDDFDPIVESSNSGQKIKKITPVAFQNECIEYISKHLELIFVKQTRSALSTKDKSVGLVCSISKEHSQGKSPKYWFAFHTYQEEYLNNFKTAYIAYGCGRSTDIFLFPFEEFKKLVPYMWTTEKYTRLYHHVVIIKKGEKYYLQLPYYESENLLDVSKYKLVI